VCPETTDVLVVGGGATGCGVARDLAMRGVGVTLVDRGGLGSGTSGRSHGLLHSGARYAGSDPDDAAACMEENRVLKSIAGACVRDTGGLFVQLDTDDPGYFGAKRGACEAAGIPTTAVDGTTAREAAPGLSDDAVRVMRVPDAVVYPSRLVAANAAAARHHGATIHTDAPVEELTVTDGRVTAAAIGGAVDDTIEPACVVNAAGAWAGEIASMAGVEVRMRPTRGVMVSVEHDGLGPVLNRCRSPSDGDIVVPHDGEVVLGTTSVAVESPDDHATPAWEVERTVSECAAMLPPVADAPTVRTWWGVRPLYGPAERGRDGRDVSRGFATLDHAADGADGLVSVVGGKLTTYRRMAESAADLVCDRLGVDAPCRTAERRLPGADAPDRLDAYVAAFDGHGPSDADVVGA
jgi:glycerol-3-phosphate dehydrogenase